MLFNMFKVWFKNVDDYLNFWLCHIIKEQILKGNKILFYY